MKILDLFENAEHVSKFLHLTPQTEVKDVKLIVWETELKKGEPKTSSTLHGSLRLNFGNNTFVDYNYPTTSNLMNNGDDENEEVDFKVSKGKIISFAQEKKVFEMSCNHTN